MVSILLSPGLRGISYGQGSTDACPDFDGNGMVEFPDFLLFVEHFGKGVADEGYDAKYDLDGNDAIAFSDFLIFVNEFGKEVDCSNSGGNTVPSQPALSAWINAEGTDSQRLLDQATICRAGLEFPRDTFCVNERQTILVGHLNSGDGLVLLGRSVFRAGPGGAIRFTDIVLESRDNVWVLTQFNP